VKVLQLTSDWKWTGPAEPMLRLARGLEERGHEVQLACPEAPEPRRDGVAARARAAGVDPVLELEPRRGVHPWRDRRDAKRLRQLLRQGGYDVVHSWHTRDHVLALRARRGLGTRVVRSWRSAAPVAARPWNRWLFGPGSDGVWCVSPVSAARSAFLRGGRPIAGGFGAVDLDRFRPQPARAEVRESLGLAPDDGVVGIVARVQRHRRFDLLLEAARRLCDRDASARVLVVGRGTHRDEVARAPAASLGLASRMLFTGYRREDYDDVLRSIDVFTLLVPGSDGSCRAVLEAAACGIPAVVTRRGALPEIVVDGETGRVVEEDPEALAGAWQDLLRDRRRRRALGEAAARRARTLFCPERLADDVEALYARVLEGTR
jgi:glycosyltransferase involved in cell wall biosynthesis